MGSEWRVASYLQSALRYPHFQECQRLLCKRGGSLVYQLIAQGKDCDLRAMVEVEFA